ncbi:MAG TPA: hypothetical protein VLH60_00555, partial [Sedimentisphaerales bacterium]|nr:hypothetical protein [Sedimentisphaerales bacterium]
NYNVAMDSGASARFAVTQIPTVFVVDHRGQVVWKGLPWDKEFDKMVRKVLQEAPPPVTSGTPLGVFESYKTQLYGGPGFADAYRQIEAQSMVADSLDAATARSIILAINLTIARKTNHAHVLRRSNPIAAYLIYADLARRYGGIPATQSAVNAMAAMKESREIKPEMYAMKP